MLWTTETHQECQRVQLLVWQRNWRETQYWFSTLLFLFTGEKLSRNSVRLRSAVPCTAPEEDQGDKFSMPPWFSCLPSQSLFLGPAHAFQGQVKPAKIDPFCYPARKWELPSSAAAHEGEVPAGPWLLRWWVSGGPQPSPGPMSYLRGDGLKGLQLNVHADKQDCINPFFLPSLSSHTCWKRKL